MLSELEKPADTTNHSPVPIQPTVINGTKFLQFLCVCKFIKLPIYWTVCSGRLFQNDDEIRFTDSTIK